ncbi:MAG: T9SS type A sorting domain-containing protein [Bacteroidota bacterium]
MKLFTTFFFALTLLFPYLGFSQCTPLQDAVANLTLSASNAGTDNRSGVVYNPNADLYYSVNAGSASYPVDCYSGTGTILTSPASGFDYRGAWWNPSAGQFEGNGFSNSGIWLHNLEASNGYPTGTGANLLGARQPNSQSVGDLDTDANAIIYYDNGFIYRFDRPSNDTISIDSILNLPVGLDSINSNSIVYTGCETREYGIYDFQNKRLLFINRANMTYNGYCQLPAFAPGRNSFGMSYANNLFWLFENGLWTSFQVVSIWPTSVEDELEASVDIFPNPAQNHLEIKYQSLAKEVLVSVLSIDGREVLQQQFANTKHLQLDISDLAPGSYIVRLRLDDQLIHRKVVKY